MTAPYSVDLRERALARKEAGETNREIAAALRISPSCVSKGTKRKRETGSLAPAQIGGYKPCTLSGESADWLRARIAAAPFTLRGLSAELAERGIKTHPRAVWVFVHAEGLSFKKDAAGEEQTRPDVARKRARWKSHQGRIGPSQLVFIDETWVKTNMAPLRLGDKGTTAGVSGILCAGPV
jgi:transposase